MKRFAVLLQCLAALLCVLTAARYMTASEFMPYHATVSGQSWQALQPGLQVIILGMLRIVAAGFLGCGIALATLAWGVHLGHSWASWAALAVGIAVWVPTLLVTLMLKAAQPAAEPPTLPTIAMLAVIIAASLLGALRPRAAAVVEA